MGLSFFSTVHVEPESSQLRVFLFRLVLETYHLNLIYQLLQKLAARLHGRERWPSGRLPRSSHLTVTNLVLIYDW